jgi:D-alanyl-D-alanine carboxypeptidase/D-alanyl-D-alanine-endopeptidase (penicillin-binding protein 4)
MPPRISVRLGLATATLLAGAAAVVGTQVLGAPSDAGGAPPAATPTPSLTEAAGPAPSPAPPTPSPTPPPPEERIDPPVLDPPPTEETPAPPAPEHAALARRLTEVLSREDLAVDGTVAVAVHDDRGQVVLENDAATTPLLPASTLKLVTSAAALTALGPEHRFTTHVLAAGRVDDDGTLRGDLLLVGGGDPVLSSPDYRSWVYPARPATRLEELAMRVRTAGIRRVTGRVIGVDAVFDPPATAAGWKDVYFSDFDARRIHALTVDASLDVDVAVPEPEDGSEPDPDAEEELTLLQSADPRVQAAEMLTVLLGERGVAVAGAPGASAVTRSGAEVAEIASPELAVLLRHTVETSDNHLADTLFRDVGRAVLADADWHAADSAVERVLLDAGVTSWAGVEMADGSGLSRDDRVTAAFLAGLDATMAASEHAVVWDDLMAVAGVEGTLRRRLVGTIGAGRFRAKTGTLDDVAAVAGSVVGPEGRRYHLAVVANDVTGGERSRVRQLMDELVLVLAEDLHGCRRVHASPGPSPATSPTPAPYTLDCATPPDGGT